METPWYVPFLACPDCAADLFHHAQTVRCARCGYERSLSRPLDLRPTNPLPVNLTLPRVFDVSPLLEHVETRRPQLTYGGPKAIRDSRELLSALQPCLPPGSRVLDLGCGPRDQAAPFEYLGHEYVGIDYKSPAADVLADAHAIPFSANSFDCVFAYAVLEHLHNPFIAIQEIKRVLRPGGMCCGTVSQGEPFHASFFHHTAWGLVSLAASAGMDVIRLWPSYDTLLSLAKMGRYPRLIKAPLRFLDTIHVKLPFLAPRRWRWGWREKELDELYRAASICFLARKQPASGMADEAVPQSPSQHRA